MKCKHDACHCKGNEAKQDGFCSDSCREGKMNGAKCACGHADCR